MPIFLDRHDVSGITATEVAELHNKDLAVQDQYNVKFMTYWFDPDRGTTFCLIDAPDIETAMHAHKKAHGNIAHEVIEVDLSAVEAFLGRIADPIAQTSGCPPPLDAAFRVVMFTDIVDSTGMTERLGDARSVEMVRAHDSIVRRALKESAGREVKHLGDGIMASFDDAEAAVRCALAIQSALDAFNLASDEKLSLRIGLHAGEPVEDSNDLFGATVQLAARICDSAEAGTVVISDQVRSQVPAETAIRDLGARSLKGFANPVMLYEVG